MPKRAASSELDGDLPRAAPEKRPRRATAPTTRPKKADPAAPRAVSATHATSQPLRLPFENVRWSDADYVAPIALLRSALFGIVPKGRRQRINQEALATVGEFKLRYTGEMLNQFDEDV